MGGGASPGVDIVTWPQILRVIWLTAAFEAVLILLVFLHDASVISAARRRAATAAERSEKARAHLLFTPAGRAEPLRVHLARLLHPFHSIIGRIIEGTAVAFGVGQWCLWIYSTYVPGPDATATTFTIIFTAFFGARLLLRLGLHEPGQRTSVLLTFDAIVDVAADVSAILPFLHYVGTFFSFVFLRMVNVYAAYSNLDASMESGILFSRIQRLLLRMALFVLAFLACFAGTLSVLENAGNPPGWGVAVQGVGGSDADVDGFTAFNAVYFAIVTFATVGYGDVTPITTLGRLFTIVYIILGIVLSGRLISALLQLLQQRGEGTGRVFNAAKRPLLLFTGDTSLGQLLEILNELFPPHARGARLHLHAVILVDGDSFRRDFVRFFQDHPSFGGHVTVLCGSVLDKSALVRAGANKLEMQAAFVLQRRFARDDQTNLMRVLALRRHLPLLPIFVMLGESASLPVALAAGVHEDSVLLSDLLRHGLLAANTVTPGAAPLLINLFSSDPPSLPLLADAWQREYVLGMGQEVREIRAPRWLVGRTLLDATILVYCARLMHDMSRDDSSASSSRALRFANVEALVHSLQARLSLATDEGPVLLAVRFANPGTAHSSRHHTARHGHLDHRGHLHHRGDADEAQPLASLISCDLLSQRKLARDDSLFVIARDLSVLGLGHDVVENGRPQMQEPTAAGRSSTSEGGIGLAPLWRRVASSLQVPADIGGAGGGALAQPPGDGFAYAALPASATAAVALPQPSPPPPPPPLLQQQQARREPLGASSVLRSISFLEAAPAAAVLPASPLAPPPLPLPPPQLSRSISRRFRPPASAPAQVHSAIATTVVLGPPPPDLRDHVVVITDAWLDSLPLFMAPLRESSSRPVVVLSPSPPSAAWLKVLHAAQVPRADAQLQEQLLQRQRRRQRQRQEATPTAISPPPPQQQPPALVAASGPCDALYFVQGSPLVSADTARARLAFARRCVIITAAPPRAPPASSSVFGLGLGLGIGNFGGVSQAPSQLSGERLLQEAHTQMAEETAVDAVAVLATMMIENALSLRAPALLFGTCTEIARNASVLLLSSAAELGDSGDNHHAATLGPASLSTNALAVQASRSTSAVAMDMMPHTLPPDGGGPSLLQRATSLRVRIPRPAPKQAAGRSPTTLPRANEAMAAAAIALTRSLSIDEDEAPSDSSDRALSISSRDDDGAAHEVRPLSPLSTRSLSPHLVDVPPEVPSATRSSEAAVPPRASAPHVMAAAATAVSAAAPAGPHGWHTSGAAEATSMRYSARFAAGRLFPTSCINSLLVGSFFNPSLIRLITMFARGTELRLRHVQIPPEAFADAGASAEGGIVYARLFLHMVLRHKVVTVGLYRAPQRLRAPLPYVLTNPAMSALVFKSDVLFVAVPVRRS